jgi:hypothetical protein
MFSNSEGQSKYFADEELTERYLVAAQRLGFKDKVVVLPDKPEFAYAALVINLSEEDKKKLFAEEMKVQEEYDTGILTYSKKA